MGHQRFIGEELHLLANLMKRFEDHSRLCRQRAGTELTDMQTRVICFLYAHRETDIFQKDIEEAFSVRRPTVSILLRKMEAKRLVTRESVPADARLKKVALTENALLLAGKAAEEIVKLETALAEGIPEKDLDVFFRVTARLKENIEKSLVVHHREKGGERR